MTITGGGAGIRNTGGGANIPTFTLTPAAPSIGSPISISEINPKNKIPDFFICIECLLENCSIYVMSILPVLFNFKQCMIQRLLSAHFSLQRGIPDRGPDHAHVDSIISCRYFFEATHRSCRFCYCRSYTIIYTMLAFPE
jgi:hypothetical protein